MVMVINRQIIIEEEEEQRIIGEIEDLITKKALKD
jgi:hypothetical protein